MAVSDTGDGGASTEPLVPDPQLVSLIGDQVRASRTTLEKILYRVNKPGYQAILDGGARQDMNEAIQRLSSVLQSLVPLRDDGGNGAGF